MGRGRSREFDPSLTLIEAYSTLVKVKESNDELDRISVPGFSTFIQKRPEWRARLGPPAARSRERYKICDAFGSSAQVQTGVLLLPRVSPARIGRSRPDRRILLFGDTVAGLGIEI